ncbi:MAG: PD-(D/E)XK nuclease family protein, partial [Oscillospiraceae bacterium]|nr:PD-(D/E)XK nuclease family protein [Oscillospiraceae bacterium]
EVLAHAEALRLRLADPVLALRKKMKGSTAAQMCRYIYEFLEEQSVMNNVTGLIAEYRNKGITDTASELERLWNCIMDAFSTVAKVLGDEMTDSSEFAELFTLIVRQNRFLAPPQKLDIVSVVSAEKARVEGQKVIFVMGANEGILPFAAKSSGLLSSTDKEAFEKMGIDLGKDTKRLLADERFVVYRLFSSASERVIISYPLCDAQGGTRFPSYILGQIAGMYSDSIKKPASGYDVLFYSPTPAAAYRNYVQGMFENEQEKASLREALYNIPEYRSRIEYLDSIGKDGVHAVSDTSLMGRLMGDRIQVSATSFEDYSECHFRYFCKYGLHIRARDRREMDFRDLGSLVHSCLENILSGCSTKDEFISLTDDDITVKIKEFAEKYKAENLAGDFGKNARLDSKFEKFTEDTLYLVNHLKEELTASQFMPEKFEFEINEATGGEPFRITGHEGTEIVLKGKIDRVDSYTDPDTGEKFIRIIDYKTGVKNFELEKIIYGIDTQMLLYLFSVTAEGGYYSDTVPAGVLYMPSGSIEIGRGRTGDDDTDAYLNKFYRMSGVVLKELKVLRAMEENIAGIYIPAKLTADAVKKGTFELDKVRSRCLTRPQFERLRTHIKELLVKMASDLLDGDVSALPLKYDPQKDVCTFCDYNEICGNFPRKYERFVPEDVKEIEMNIL